MKYSALDCAQRSAMHHVSTEQDIAIGELTSLLPSNVVLFVLGDAGNILEVARVLSKKSTATEQVHVMVNTVGAAEVFHLLEECVARDAVERILDPTAGRPVSVRSLTARKDSGLTFRSGCD